MRMSRVHSIAFIFVMTLALSLPLGVSHDVAAQTDCSRPLTADRVEDSWTAECQSQSRQNSYARYYTFTLTEQAVVTITLESETDSYLFLLDYAEDIIVENDDIDTGNFNSRVTRTLDPGDYTIEATTYDGAATGNFTLAVTGINFTDQSDRAALIALYNASDGDNWRNNTNWLTDSPLNEWHGVSTDEDGRVTELDLPENNLSGHIPPEIGNLVELTYLILRSNRLTGTVPSELGKLTGLEVLALDDNKLWGELPDSMTALTRLILFFSLNNSGLCVPDGAEFQEWLQTIPSGFAQFITCNPPSTTSDAGDLTVLATLYKATGGDNWDDNTNWFSEQPLQYWKGVTINSDGRVTRLSLGTNLLSGYIPSELGNLSSLEWLLLDENQLSDDIPSELGNLSRLERLHLGENQLSGDIPSEFGTLDNLIYMDLDSNRLTDDIPSELGNLSRLERLHLGENQLSGDIPSEFGILDNLIYLNLASNRLTDNIPAELGSLSILKFLDLHNNQFNGAIPRELGTLSNLNFLSLSNNQLTGALPTELSSLTELGSLYLGVNQLTGEVPRWLGNFNQLVILSVNDNQFTGSIPPELGNLPDLGILRLHNNQLDGTVPHELGNLIPGLEELFLAGNQLTGCIPNVLRGVEANDFYQLALPFCTDTQPDPDPTPESPECLESLPDEMTVEGTWDTGCTSNISAPGGNGDRYARFYTFTIDAESDVTIDLSSVEDTFLYLREDAGPDGNVLHENDDIVSGNTNSQIQQTLSAGTYTIEATTYNAGVTGEFTLTVSGLPSAAEPELTPEPTPTPEPIPGPSPEPTPEPPADSCAETISVDGLISGSWSGECVSGSRSGSYASYYTFTLTENSEVTITLESPVDTYLYLRQGAGRDGSVLYENDDILVGSDTNSRLSVTLQPGDYTIEATTYGAGATGQFTLAISGLPAVVTPTPEPTPEPTPTPSADSCVEIVSGDGMISGGWNSDCPSESRSGSYASYYTFTLTETAEVTTTLESSVDTFLYLREGAGRDGNVLHENDDIVSGNTNSRIQKTLSAGTYTIEATTYEAGTTGDFNLTVSVLPATIGPQPTPTPAPTPTPEPTPTPAPIYTSATDRAALVSLYNATGGANWKNKANWLSDAPSNEWYGVSTDPSARVISLILENNGMSGPFPSELTTLSQLQDLRLGFDGLTGTLPPELGNLTNLHTITLNDNRLSGTIPRELGRLRNLRTLDIGSNDLTGVIPRELGNLDRLVKLSLGSNRLEGEIPDELGSLIQLQYLVLANNVLSGEIPEALGDLVNLHELLLDTNKLTGQVPYAIGNLTELQRLWIQRNQLTGQVPQTLTALTGLRSFLFDTNDGLCAPTDREVQEWLHSIDEVTGDTCSTQLNSDRIIFEGGIDLGIAYVERLPRYQRYKVTYSDDGPCGYPFEEFKGPVLCPGEEGLKRWPETGESIDLIAHVWNFGDTASGPFEYVWSIDGTTTSTGRHDGLESGEYVEVVLSMDWPDGNRNTKVTMSLDPADAIDELLENNNSLDDWVKGFTIGFYFSPVSYKSLSFSNRPGETIQSPEYWVHNNVSRLNELLADAGLEDRVRGELFEVTEDRHLWSGHPLQWHTDGWWPVWDNLPQPSFFDLDGYRDRPEIDNGLLHELLHQLGVIDLYQMYTGPEAVLLPDVNRPGFQAGCGTDYWNHDWECFRFTGDLFDIMAAGPNFIGTHTAGGLKSNAGHRRGFYGEYLYDTPESTSIRIVDENDDSQPDVMLRFYQYERQEDGHIVDTIPEFELTTDDSGLAVLPNRGITGIVTTTGHQLKPNPFGLIDVVGTNGQFLIEMESSDCTNYEWLTIVELNLAYWNGHTERVTFDKTHRCPPVYPNSQSGAQYPPTLPPEYKLHTFWLLDPVPQSP